MVEGEGGEQHGKKSYQDQFIAECRFACRIEGRVCTFAHFCWQQQAGPQTLGGHGFEKSTTVCGLALS